MQNEQQPSSADAESLFAEFVAGFRRSASGNLTRTYEGATVTVFRRSGSYCWCINPENDAPYFSDEPLGTERDALLALARQLFVFCVSHGHLYAVT